MMEKQELRRAIEEWQQYLLRVREVSTFRQPASLPDVNLGVALIGVRRSGKTYQAIQASAPLPVDKVLYFNFEDPICITNNSTAFLEQLLATAQEFRSTQIELLILDEIQNIQGWERWLRKIIDQKKYRVIITGSSASLLESELATSLTGRCLEYKIWPLSFSEFLTFKKIEKPISRLETLSAVREFMTWGSLPEVTKQQDLELKKKILQQYLGDIVHRDVVNRHSIRNKLVLDQILTYYLTNISSLHSYSALSKAFATTPDTASEYTQALNEAFLIFEVTRYHQNLKVQARDPKKIYAVDLGLRSAVARSIHDDSSRLLENIVYIELRRRDRQISYFKERYEVDFIISESYKATEAIQVCYDFDNATTREREIRGLSECMQSLELKNATIISYDHEEDIVVDSHPVRIVPIYKWLT
jgi:predicted AAA+ superfamily ATPase